MEASPLTQQSRPESFKPKIVQLYENLLKNAEDLDPSEGFWREFFLLPPDRNQLHAILDHLSPDDILSLQTQTQLLFTRAIREAAAGVAPADSYALDTLTIFLTSILSKKYTNPSSDVITVLAGLDEVDHVISDFVAVLDGIIRNGSRFDVRLKAIRTAVAMTSGAYKTSLVSYLTHRDLFPSLMKYVSESDTPMQVFDPFLLLGLLANYNKFEFQNPYQLRLDDFVNESSIQKIAKGVGLACGGLRNGYIAVQDDIPEGWNLTNTLIFFGLRAFAPGAREKANPPTAEEAKAIFAELPAQEAAILMATYDFTNANKLFGYHLVHSKSENNEEESPFSSFLSLTSYLLQHAYRSPRVGHYAELTLFTLRILVEDPIICKHICNEDGKRKVRICRQKQPYLPVVSGDRVLAAIIFDIMIDTITHNLRRRLDVNLYSHAIAITLRLLTYLSKNKIRLTYHWSELWRTLLSLMRFLTTYAADLTINPKIQTLTSSLADLIAFCVSGGDTFLPDPSSYDDLFYKLVETGPIISKFRAAYALTGAGSTSKAAEPGIEQHVAAIDTLQSVSTHFYALLFYSDGDNANAAAVAAAAAAVSPKPDEPASVPLPSIRKKNLSPREVHRIIKQGYDTLSIQPPEGLSTWAKWREAEWKSELKRAARCAVDDARQLVA
ncbi:hypothetical protein N7499_000714 [Penicillium canescens]|uniref:Armadillo-like helical domain-containing protein n=1 Tax=Penicillium canescens TaxID=5083 RepID=A0AAD6IHD8_PENCN|nr:uncharacterized protein N7446_011082 [Penicillium canescens]KAJ6029567.1 hypothetical protein N7444_012554 [Penicillium canescens]KAJ6047998.1 hypothetical protein N7460_004145 [Penicillium canescens]KAJ6048399.1 hypothetical protein N7446_011082 [Penicillium canescens]KAJ6101084.1 hypothetical protein N7499_000714 [Penicillium canescens]KAJ6173542.1 hypothetical protein N7485_006354 [Penicillium canescens]